MSTKPTSLTKIPPSLTAASKDADAMLVKKIIEKSKEGKLIWIRSGDTYLASTENGALSAKLAVSPNSIMGNIWSQFIVRTNSKEILRLEHEPNYLTALSVLGRSPASVVVDQLVEFLEGARRSEVAEAISALDRL